MVWLPDDEKMQDMIARFDTIHKRDKQQDGRTDGRTHTHRTTAYSAVA